MVRKIPARGRLLPLVPLLMVACFGSAAAGENPPDSVRLESLAVLYEGVRFEHAIHVDLVQNCARCHHHTAGAGSVDENCRKCHAVERAGKVSSCRGCHPVSPFSAEYLAAQKKDVNRYHTAQLGLKGAYHRSCLGCHAESGGPVGCRECHARSRKGDALFHAGVRAGRARPAGHGH